MSELPAQFITDRRSPLRKVLDASRNGRAIEIIEFDGDRGQRRDAPEVLVVPDDLLDALGRDKARVDRPAPRGLLVEDRDVHVAEGGEGERARDGRRRHHQLMRRTRAIATLVAKR